MTGTRDLCHPETVRVAAQPPGRGPPRSPPSSPPSPAPAWSCPAPSPNGAPAAASPTARCHADPPRLHGPYWQWTRKVAAKTVCRWLSADQHRDYQAWIDNDRRLRELLARLEALGAAAFEADPRSQRHTHNPGTTRQLTHEPVGNGRLTCGQAPNQRPSGQLTPKREDLTRSGTYFEHCTDDYSAPEGHLPATCHL